MENLSTPSGMMKRAGSEMNFCSSTLRRVVGKFVRDCTMKRER